MRARRAAISAASAAVGVALAMAWRRARGRQVLGRQLRRLRGRWNGLVYRARGRRPSPHVPDDILADRIRSALGPLERRLDVPRVHVMVRNRTAVLHGEVPSLADAKAIEAAVLDVPGVRQVDSRLRIGLSRGATRPSAGRARRPPSPARLRLLEAARRAGLPPDREEDAVRAVLGTLAERLPAGEWEDVLSHLPADARSLASEHRRSPRRIKTVEAFAATVAWEAGIDLPRARSVTREVMAALRSLVPEEDRDVAASLPAELRELWSSATPR